MYLTLLGESRGLMLHGSGRPDFDVFTPRTAHDQAPDAFRKRRAVFGTTDGIWAIFYAILARKDAAPTPSRPHHKSKSPVLDGALFWCACKDSNPGPSDP